MYTKFYADLTIRADEFDALSAVYKLLNPDSQPYVWPVHRFFTHGRLDYLLTSHGCGPLEYRSSLDLDTGHLRVAAETKGYQEYLDFMDWIDTFLDPKNPQVAVMCPEASRFPSAYTMFPQRHNPVPKLLPLCLQALPDALVHCSGHRHATDHSFWAIPDLLDEAEARRPWSEDPQEVIGVVLALGAV
jgi:hypothetical protein